MAHATVMGYSPRELADLEATLNAVATDAGTPIDLGRLMKLNKPIVRARYDFADLGQPLLKELVVDFLQSCKFRKQVASRLSLSGR
jgi:predicted GTPase